MRLIRVWNTIKIWREGETIVNFILIFDKNFPFNLIVVYSSKE